MNNFGLETMNKLLSDVAIESFVLFIVFNNILSQKIVIKLLYGNRETSIVNFLFQSIKVAIYCLSRKTIFWMVLEVYSIKKVPLFAILTRNTSSKFCS